MSADNNFNSKKLFVTLFFGLIVVAVPLVYSVNKIGDSVSLAVVAILGGIGIAFGIVQGKIDLENAKTKPAELDLDKLK